MVPSKLNAKYHIWIWVGLVFASFIRNIYAIYFGFTNLESGSASALTINILYTLFVDGIIPAFLCYLCASIVYSFGFRRYVRAISRNDFIYITMIFTAAARVLIGIIEAFAILDARVFTFTSSVLDVTILSAAMFLMYFLVFVPKYKLNPVEKYNSFSSWSMWYLLGLGILNVLPNFTVIMLSDGSQTSSQLLQILQEYYGITLLTDPLQLAACITAVCVYFAIVVAVIVISQVMRKKAADYKDPEKREQFFQQNKPNYFTDYDSVYGDPTVGNNQTPPQRPMEGEVQNGGKDENVFDEFDI